MVKEEFGKQTDWIPCSIFTIPLIFFDDRLNIRVKTDPKLLHSVFTSFTVSFCFLFDIVSNYLHLISIPIQILNHYDQFWKNLYSLFKFSLNKLMNFQALPVSSHTKVSR